MEKIKVQFINKIPPKEERKEGLFYYDIRNSETDNGYLIEKRVLVNNIGSLVTTKDILGDKKFLSNDEFEALEYEEVNDLYVKPNSIEQDIELE